MYWCVFRLIKSYITIDQHDFMEEHSTICNLANFSQYTVDTLDDSGEVDAIYTYIIHSVLAIH